VIELTSCNQTKPKGDTKTMNFDSFSIRTPQSWTAIKKHGVESYVGSIDDKDTIGFDLGWYSNRLYEYDPTILDSSIMANIDTCIVDTSEVIFVKNRTKVDPD
jgi:hypothetical protein